jgi:PEP-CTERM motif
MSRKQALPMILLAAFCVTAPNSFADVTTSYTGTLASPEDAFTTTLTLAAAGGVTLQSWSFGGGTNGAGDLILAGGFDPLLAVFAGTGSGATILTDGMGNAIAGADTLSTFPSYTGCPPAGEVNIGGDVCGDVTMSLSLPAGTYTILLSDAGYIPNAVYDNGTLGEGFTDFTGGVFQTCNTVGSTTTCASDTANWAFDVTAPGSSSTPPVPEPGTFLLFTTGLLGVGASRSRRFLSRR